NYYYSSTVPYNTDALLVSEGGVAYASGNYSPVGLNIDVLRNQATPFAAAIVPSTTDAITAAHQIVAQAGARGPGFGLDAIDLSLINQLSLTPPPAATTAPGDLGL